MVLCSLPLLWSCFLDIHRNHPLHHHHNRTATAHIKSISSAGFAEKDIEAAHKTALASTQKTLDTDSIKQLIEEAHQLLLSTACSKHRKLRLAYNMYIVAMRIMPEDFQIKLATLRTYVRVIIEAGLSDGFIIMLMILQKRTLNARVTSETRARRNNSTRIPESRHVDMQARGMQCLQEAAELASKYYGKQHHFTLQCPRL